MKTKKRKIGDYVRVIDVDCMNELGINWSTIAMNVTCGGRNLSVNENRYSVDELVKAASEELFSFTSDQIDSIIEDKMVPGG